jgi:hypothetical protein
MLEGDNVVEVEAIIRHRFWEIDQDLPNVPVSRKPACHFPVKDGCGMTRLVHQDISGRKVAVGKTKVMAIGQSRATVFLETRGCDAMEDTINEPVIKLAHGIKGPAVLTTAPEDYVHRLPVCRLNTTASEVLELGYEATQLMTGHFFLRGGQALPDFIKLFTLHIFHHNMASNALVFCEGVIDLGHRYSGVSRDKRHGFGLAVVEKATGLDDAVLINADDSARS